jgi:hypothetical protein
MNDVTCEVPRLRYRDDTRIPAGPGIEHSLPKCREKCSFSRPLAVKMGKIGATSLSGLLRNRAADFANQAKLQGARCQFAINLVKKITYALWTGDVLAVGSIDSVHNP